MHSEWTITAVDEGEKLVSFLKKAIFQKFSIDYSLKRLKSFIDAGYCTLNERKERFANTRLSSSDRVQLSLPETLDVQKKALDILYEDADIVIYNKSCGVVCDKTLEEELSIFLTHRLDKDTTGVLVCAKNEPTQKLFFEQFRGRQIEKEYVALCAGIIHKKCGTIQNYLKPLKRFSGGTLYGEAKNESEGVFAHTDWECIKSNNDVTYIRLFPHTGRTHQLRVHLKLLGHPILGDALYAKESHTIGYIVPRQMLHAQKLSFLHPRTQKRVEVIAPLPDDFCKAIQNTIEKPSCDI